MFFKDFRDIIGKTIKIPLKKQRVNFPFTEGEVAALAHYCGDYKNDYEQGACVLLFNPTARGRGHDGINSNFPIFHGSVRTNTAGSHSGHYFISAKYLGIKFGNQEEIDEIFKTQKEKEEKTKRLARIDALRNNISQYERCIKEANAELEKLGAIDNKPIKIKPAIRKLDIED